MKNTLADLNGYLFECLESLSNTDLTNEELDKEIKRAATVGSVANQIIANADLVLKAERMKAEVISPKSQGLVMLGLGNE